jgi:tRNA (guanine10-N2)-dimethyltransferase
MIIIETTKEPLAEAELRAFDKTAIKHNNLYLTSDKSYYKQLAHCNQVFDIKKPAPKNSFKLSFYGIKNKDHYFDLAKELKSSGKKIDLKNPDTEIAIVRHKKIYVTTKIYENTKDYLKRDPKFREGFHPGACSSKFAKTLINLTGLQKGVVVDPFCGTGGMLIEGAKSGFEVIGYDINHAMLEKAKINCKQFGVAATIENKDALTITKKCGAIVTELPFGKTTVMDRSNNQLIQDFLKQALKCTSKVVIAFPSHFNPKTPCWKKEAVYTKYIHKTLSKKIYVLSRI